MPPGVLWVRYLDSYHIFRKVDRSWSNSNIMVWESQPWALALLYMNPGQDPTNTSPADTDVSGILNIMLFCNRFNMDKAVVEKIRDMRNGLIHHTPTFKVDVAEFTALLDTIEQLLLDKALTNHISVADRNSAVNYLKQVKTMKLEITCNDEISVLRKMMQDMKANDIKHLEDVIAGHEDLINALSKSVPEIQQKVEQLETTSVQHEEDINKIKVEMEETSGKQEEVIKEMHVTKKQQEDDTKEIKGAIKETSSKQEEVIKEIYATKKQQEEDIKEIKGTMKETSRKQEKVIKEIHVSKRQQEEDTKEIKGEMEETSRKQDKIIKEIHATMMTAASEQQKEVIKEIHETKRQCEEDIIYMRVRTEQHGEDIAELYATKRQRQDDIKDIKATLGQQDEVIREMKESIEHHGQDIGEDCKVQLVHPEITTGRKSTATEALQQELVACYSQPDFSQLCPLLDDDTFGYFIDSVFVEVSLTKRQVELIRGLSGLEDNLKQKGKEVRNIDAMIPPVGGHRVLLTGFVGSGKTSLSFHWISQYAAGKRKHDPTAYCREQHVRYDSTSNIHKYEIAIFLRARALELNVLQSLANLLEIENLKLNEKKHNLIQEAFLEEPSTLIIIDGYDEASPSQKSIVDNLASSKTLSHCSVIITSRPNFFHGQVDSWYENQGFNKKQQIMFIDKFKSTLPEEQEKHFENFKKRFHSDQNATNIFNSPMMAMTTCHMVAEGEDVEFESRVKNYEQVTDFLASKACFKYNIEPNDLKEAMPGFTKVAYTFMLEQNSFHFSREQLLVHISADVLDNIIVRLGYLSYTKYSLRARKQFAYAFVHKSWAEFTAARYVMSLVINDRCKAVCQLFRSGAANLEVLRFVLGLCCKDEPQHLVTLIRAIGELVTSDLDIDDEQMEMITAIDEDGEPDIMDGSCYLLMLLVDVVPGEMPPAAARALCRVCVAIKEAAIDVEAVNACVQGQTDTVPESASAVYSGLLLTAHDAQSSLHTVQRLEVKFDSSSSHSAITRLPATLAACAPRMTNLTQVHVDILESATVLGAVCGGLEESGAKRLTSLKLWGHELSNLMHEWGGDLSALVLLIRAATQLSELNLSYIHVGEEQQLQALCVAVGEALQLTHLTLYKCNVTPQQYSDVLLPALCGRQSAGGVRLQEVTLGIRQEEQTEGEEWQKMELSEEEEEALTEQLQEVAEEVTIE